MLRERVVHPRVKVTLLAELTLATASTVPFTLSVAVAATIDPYFAFTPLPPLANSAPRIVSPGSLLRQKLSFLLRAASLYGLGQGYIILAGYKLIPRLVTACCISV